MFYWPGPLTLQGPKTDIDTMIIYFIHRGELSIKCDAQDNYPVLVLYKRTKLFTTMGELRKKRGVLEIT